MAFQISVIVLFCVLVAIRFYFRARVGLAANRPRVAREGRFVVAARMVLTALLGVVVALETYRPGVPAWLHVPLPDGLRWLGLGVGGLGLMLLWFTHRALGREFSTTLTVRTNATLVTWGPYAWMRHPMYVAYLGVFVGASLLTANWMIFVLGTLVIGLLMSVRLRKEEAMLEESFGEEYRQYSMRVARFVPHLKRRY